MNKLFILSALIVLGLVSFVSADVGDYCAMGGMMTGTYGAGGMFFGWIIWLLVVVALVLLIAWLIKQLQTPKRRRR